MTEPRPGTTMGRIAELEKDVRELRAVLDIALDDLRVALARISALEAAAPEARQAQYEADVAIADAVASDYRDERPDPEDIRQ